MTASVMAQRALAASLALAVLAACNGDDGDGSGSQVNDKPAFVGAITKTVFDGNTDDLLTGGMGKTAFGGATPPAVAVATAPTAAELRRLALFNNYRALVDVNPNGGYGTLYGPNIDINGGNTLGEGKVPGNEYMAYADDGTGNKNVTMVVQVPTAFTLDRPCIVTATSSGSRGVYGAIGTAGEWGLKHACAVAYTDKGSGIGVHDLATNTVNLQNGVRSDAATAGKNTNFTGLSAADIATFNAAYPNRIAVKHAHSQQNPEADWGNDTLNAVRFAFYVLNEQIGRKNADGTTFRTLTASNTIVIASSASNGAGAAIAALEQDSEGLIDGLAVSEPSIALPANPNLKVTKGTSTIVGAGRPLYDYFTLANLLQPCAALSTRVTSAPGIAFINATVATNRCAGLKAKGILTKATAQEQADEALDQLVAYGYQPESNLLHASLYALATPAIAMTYSNTYGRFSVKDNLCGFSFAATDAAAKPAPIAAAALAQYFGTGNGVPPSGAINIINNLSLGGAVNSGASVSPSTGQLDYNVDGAQCQRLLWTAADANAVRVKNGVNEILRNGNLRGRPAIIVHGRNDGLIPVSFTSRPYFGQNRIVEGAASKLSYIEVTNAQHFDAFIDNALLPGYDSMFVPLHYYFIQAMDKVWGNLTQNAPLPASQVVRTIPRGGTPGKAPAITLANVPPMLTAPAAGDQITFSNNTVTIPE